MDDLVAQTEEAKSFDEILLTDDRIPKTFFCL
jgi:hypothetical protein